MAHLLMLASGSIVVVVVLAHHHGVHKAGRGAARLVVIVSMVLVHHWQVVGQRGTGLAVAAHDATTRERGDRVRGGQHTGQIQRRWPIPNLTDTTVTIDAQTLQGHIAHLLIPPDYRRRLMLRHEVIKRISFLIFCR